MITRVRERKGDSGVDVLVETDEGDASRKSMSARKCTLFYVDW